MFEILVIALLGFIIIRSFIMSEAIERLTQQVAATTALEASAVALITGIAGQLRDAAGDEAAVNALADQLEQGAGGLAEAVKANTPAETVADTGTADTGTGGGEGGADTGAAGAGEGAGEEAGAGTGAAEGGEGAATTGEGEGGGAPTT